MAARELLPWAMVTMAAFVWQGCQLISGVGDLEIVEGPPTTTSTSTGPPPAACGVDPGCDDYCLDRIKVCNGENLARQFETDEDCCATCGTWDKGGPEATDGNSLSCRLFYVALVPGDTVDSDRSHCGIAGPSGGETCGEGCEVFCALSMKACGDLWPWVESPEACTEACNSLPRDGQYDVDESAKQIGNLSCYLYLATLAAFHPLDHCGALDPAAEISPCN